MYLKSKRAILFIVVFFPLTSTFAASCIEFANPIKCFPENKKTILHFYRRKALQINKYPYNIAKIKLAFKGKTKIAPTGKYLLFFKIERILKTSLLEVALGNTIKQIKCPKTRRTQWLGPIDINASTSFSTVDIRGTDFFRIQELWIQSTTAPALKLAKCIKTTPIDNGQTVWIDWPKSLKYPFWATEKTPVYLSFRSAGKADEAAQIEIKVLNYKHQKIALLSKKIKLGNAGKILIPVPKQFGSYLLRIAVNLPNGKKCNYQKVISRISSPTLFYSDMLGGHGNYELLGHLGAGWDRMWDAGQSYLLWRALEPEKGTFNWQDKLPPKPLKTIVVLETIPKWATNPFKDMTDWLNYVKAVVTYNKGKISIYEIFNERYSEALKRTKQYAKIIKATADIIHNTDPDALVATGGPPDEIHPGIKWWEKTVKAGVFDSVDVITAHLYFGAGGTHPTDQDIRFDAYVTALRRILNARGLKNKKIIDSESGLAPMESFYIGRKITYGLWGGRGFSPKNPVPYQVGTAMAARFLLLHFWHSIPWMYYHTIWGHGNAWSICDSDGTPLPAAVSIAQLTRFFDKAVPDGKPTLPKNIWGVSFKKGNKSIVTLWAINLRRGEKRFIIPSENKNVQILDMFVNRLPVVKKYELGIAPLIVVGTSNNVAAFIKNLKVINKFDKKKFSSKTIHSVLTYRKGKGAPKLTASSTAPGYSLNPICDGVSIGTGTVTDSWTHKSGSSEEIITYEWNKPQKINWITVGWAFGFRPKQYVVEWFDGSKWKWCQGTPNWRKPNETIESYPIRAIKTSKLRMRIRPYKNKNTMVTEFSALDIPRITPPVMEMQEIYNEDFAPTSSGFITDWLVCGPFPAPGNRFQQKGEPVNWKRLLLANHYHYGSIRNDNNIRPTVDREHFVSFPDVEKVQWPHGKARVAWFPYHTKNANFINLAGALKSTELLKQKQNIEQCYAYAVCYITLKKDFNGVLSIGSDDGYRIWIDKKLFAQKVTFRGAGQDQEKYPVKLKKGEHRILLKIHNDIGGHGFFVRFLDKTGTPFTSYKVKVVP